MRCGVVTVRLVTSGGGGVTANVVACEGRVMSGMVAVKLVTGNDLWCYSRQHRSPFSFSISHANLPLLAPTSSVRPNSWQTGSNTQVSD